MIHRHSCQQSWALYIFSRHRVIWEWEIFSIAQLLENCLFCGLKKLNSTQSCPISNIRMIIRGGGDWLIDWLCPFALFPLQYLIQRGEIEVGCLICSNNSRQFWMGTGQPHLTTHQHTHLPSPHQATIHSPSHNSPTHHSTINPLLNPPLNHPLTRQPLTPTHITLWVFCERCASVGWAWCVQFVKLMWAMCKRCVSIVWKLVKCCTCEFCLSCGWVL